MAKKNKYNDVSSQTQDEALKAAKATQRPGQTKERTKLIAQGIEKGIRYYKKQQKGKSRELNKKINKFSQQLMVSEKVQDKDFQVNRVNKLSVLPWVLLFISWAVFTAYFFIN